MKTQAKRILSVTMTVIMLFAAVSAVTVNAQEAAGDTVKVIVKNTNFAKADGAVWDGVLLNTDVALTAEDTMMTAIVKALESNSYTIDVSKGYITEVNGLSEYANKGSGGWMATLNDWFTADGASSYTVSNGTLNAGDEITVMYSNDWGEDCGGHFGNFDTSLLNLTVDGASLTKAFSSEQTEYSLSVSSRTADIKVIPEANNKNYQARVYKNDYLPAQNGVQYKSTLSVKAGDTVYIGIGNSAWPSMNSWSGTADETVYTLNVVYTPVKGDIDGDGQVKVADVTLGQQYLAEFLTLDDDAVAAGDINGDGKITIGDITNIQRIIAEY